MSSNKTAIITGVGPSIGAATANRYVNDGFNVVLTGRTKSKLDTIAQEIGNDDKVLICEGDVADPYAVTKIINETIEKFGAIDALINNAGSMLLMIKAAIPYIRKNTGSILNVSSVSGIGGDWGMFAYNTTKGAVSNLTRDLALDLGKEGIRINAVAPSLTETYMAGEIIADKAKYSKLKERMPLGRAAQPEEIADVIAYLTSNDARFVNGVVLPVDGSLSASNGKPPLD